jgi:energy-converting hydrogenase Eha subunit F
MTLISVFCTVLELLVIANILMPISLRHMDLYQMVAPNAQQRSFVALAVIASPDQSQLPQQDLLLLHHIQELTQLQLHLLM